MKYRPKLLRTTFAKPIAPLVFTYARDEERQKGYITETYLQCSRTPHTFRLRVDELNARHGGHWLQTTRGRFWQVDCELQSPLWQWFFEWFFVWFEFLNFNYDIFLHLNIWQPTCHYSRMYGTNIKISSLFVHFHHKRPLNTNLAPKIKITLVTFESDTIDFLILINIDKSNWFRWL